MTRTSSCHNISAPKDLAPSLPQLGRSNVSGSCGRRPEQNSALRHSAMQDDTFLCASNASIASRPQPSRSPRGLKTRQLSARQYAVSPLNHTTIRVHVSRTLSGGVLKSTSGWKSRVVPGRCSGDTCPLDCRSSSNSERLERCHCLPRPCRLRLCALRQTRQSSKFHLSNRV